MSLQRIAGLSLGLVIASITPSAAQGLVDLHEKVRVGSKICMKDHFHDGHSAGHKSRDDAEQAAVKAWEDFTALEYGSAWGRFSRAESKGERCQNSGGSWGCSVQARPCRPR